MTRLINAVLVSAFAFFVFLGIFWQFAGGGTGAGARGDPAVTDVTPRWEPAKQDLDLQLTVHNPAGTKGSLVAVTYTATVDDSTIDKAVARVPPGGVVPVAAKGDGTVHFTVHLPDTFPKTWWTSYMKDAEHTSIRIQGTVAVQRDDGVHQAPFEWHSDWTGDLAKHLQSAVRNCGESPSDLCLSSSTFTWKDGSLHAHLVLHNPGPDSLALGNSTLRLLFADDAVVSGNVDLVRTINPGDDASVDLALGFSQTAIDSWWPDHLARCERTAVSLGMDLQVQTPPQDANDTPEVTTLQWLFPASTFQTHFACS